jgi:hypothetical protein
MQGRDSGNGKTSPFGNGQGNSEVKGFMSDNLQKQTSSTRTPPADRFPKNAPQKPAGDDGRDAQSAAPGGRIPVVRSKVDPPNVQKPYKLGGG